MFCTQCGKEILPGNKFCGNCGAKVIEPQTPVQMQPVIQPQIQSAVPPQMQSTMPPQMSIQEAAGVQQKDTFYVRKLPIVVIILLTAGLFITSLFTGPSSLTVAMLFASVPGLVLLFMIYKMDSIEPEPVSLLVKLFLCGGILVPIYALIVGSVVDTGVELILGPFPLLHSLGGAFLSAALVEEFGKYFALKTLTWKHPAFNYRFDGVVYSTTVALGFDIVENILYLLGTSNNVALMRAAFPGHCVFGIYMGYFYGQAKSLELSGDPEGARKLRRKGVLIAILIHGFYDFCCDVGSFSDSYFFAIIALIGLIVLMSTLNVTAYKNIKRYAHEDRPV